MAEQKAQLEQLSMTAEQRERMVAAKQAREEAQAAEDNAVDDARDEAEEAARVAAASLHAEAQADAELSADEAEAEERVQGEADTHGAAMSQGVALVKDTWAQAKAAAWAEAKAGEAASRSEAAALVAGGESAAAAAAAAAQPVRLQQQQSSSSSSSSSAADAGFQAPPARLVADPMANPTADAATTEGDVAAGSDAASDPMAAAAERLGLGYTPLRESTVLAAPAAAAEAAAEQAPTPEAAAAHSEGLSAAEAARAHAKELRAVAAEKVAAALKVADGKGLGKKGGAAKAAKAAAADPSKAEQLGATKAKKATALRKLKGDSRAEAADSTATDEPANAAAAAPPGKIVCVAIGAQVTDGWCQSNFDAVGKSFHNAQCKCTDPTVALRNVDPALAAAAAANAAVAKQAVISDAEKKQKKRTAVSLAAAEPVLTSCRAIQAGISDAWCLSNCIAGRASHLHSKREAYCPSAMCQCS